jgi:DHA1 family bicyclomycin/chloramphenicol resistance-like MFS transporter
MASSLSNPVRFLDRNSPPHVLTLVILAGVSTLAMNIFLPSLPGMARYFGVDYALMQLSVSLYLAGSAVLQLIIGPISDRFGRRVVILAALIAFIVATIAAIFAPSLGWFLACRVAQAVVATGMALSRAVIRDMVPADEAASMIGYVTMGMSVVPMIGPAIGGALDEFFGWQASFVLLALAGLATTVLIWTDLGETVQPSGRSLATQIREYPELLTSPRFWGYCLAATFASGSFFAYLGGSPFLGAEVFHLSPAIVGYYFAAPAIGYGIGNFIAGRYSVRFGIDRMVLVGCVISTLSLCIGALAARSFAPHPLLFFPVVGVMALGNGLTLPNANAGMLSVRPHLAGSASGLGGAMMIGGGSAIAACVGLVLTAQNGQYALLEVMAVASTLSVAAILLVIRRNRRLDL